MESGQSIKGNPTAERTTRILLEIGASIGRADLESMDLAELHCVINRIELSITQARRHLEESSD